MGGGVLGGGGVRQQLFSPASCLFPGLTLSGSLRKGLVWTHLFFFVELVPTRWLRFELVDFRHFHQIYSWKPQGRISFFSPHFIPLWVLQTPHTYTVVSEKYHIAISGSFFFSMNKHLVMGMCWTFSPRFFLACFSISFICTRCCTGFWLQDSISVWKHGKIQHRVVELPRIVIIFLSTQLLPWHWFFIRKISYPWTHAKKRT